MDSRDTERAMESIERSNPQKCPHLEGFDPLEKEQIGEPYPWLARARREAPVFYMPKYDLWCITRHADVMSVYKSTDVFSNKGAHAPQIPMPDSIRAKVGPDWEYPLPGNLNVEDPPEHMRMKRIFLQAFTASIAGMQPWIIATVDQLIDKFIDSREVDLVQALSWPMTVASIAHVMGVADEDTVRFREWAEAFFELSGSSQLPPARTEQCWKSLTDMDRFIQDMIAARRANPREDMISRVVELQRGGAPIKDREIVVNFFGLVAAGSDTTAQLLGQLIYQLLTNSEQFELLKADPSRIDNAIEEALRLRGPVRGLIRTTTRETKVGDVTIPAGRDEALFDEPDRFDITRGNAKKHAAFGAFTRLCLGAPLARMEVKTAIFAILKRLPGIKLSPRQGALEYSNSIVVPSIKRLIVTW
jgi:cytochrome P450